MREICWLKMDDNQLQVLLIARMWHPDYSWFSSISVYSAILFSTIIISFSCHLDIWEQYLIHDSKTASISPVSTVKRISKRRQDAMTYSGALLPSVVAAMAVFDPEVATSGKANTNNSSLKSSTITSRRTSSSKSSNAVLLAPLSRKSSVDRGSSSKSSGRRPSTGRRKSSSTNSNNVDNMKKLRKKIGELWVLLYPR